MPFQFLADLLRCSRRLLPSPGWVRQTAHAVPPFRNAAKCLVFIKHADVFGLVEAAEHADLREFGDTCEEDKT